MVLFFLSLSLPSVAQSGSVIRKTYAYYFQSIRGNYPSNQNIAVLDGKVDTIQPLPARFDTFIVIYAETKSKHILWDMAWQNKQPYHITALPLEQTGFQAGFVKAGSQLILKPAKGNFLWQLHLSPTGSIKNTPVKITKDKIILKGQYKGKKIEWKTAPLVEIVPMPPA